MGPPQFPVKIRILWCRPPAGRQCDQKTLTQRLAGITTAITRHLGTASRDEAPGEYDGIGLAGLSHSLSACRYGFADAGDLSGTESRHYS